MEDRLAFYGGCISFLGKPGTEKNSSAGDPTAAMYAPFSDDFRWVPPPDWTDGPIHCTEGQAAAFKSLWSFMGEPVSGERVMQRAGLDSDKPIDLFKVRTRDKGKPEAERPLAANQSLVVTKRREGLYSMPCAAGNSFINAKG